MGKPSAIKLKYFSIRKQLIAKAAIPKEERAAFLFAYSKGEAMPFHPSYFEAEVSVT